MTTNGAKVPSSGRNGTSVLVVEDEPAIAQAIARRFTAEGWAVEAVGDGLAGVAAAARLQPDVVVLDVMLPGIDGLEVCRRIQADRPVPVLMLTARDDETDMLIGLGVGADDYMTKPFSMRELVARTKALLRRTERAARAVEMATAEQPDPPLVFGDVTVDRAQRRVTRRWARSTVTSPKTSGGSGCSAAAISTARAARSVRRSSALVRATSSRIENGLVM